MHSEKFRKTTIKAIPPPKYLTVKKRDPPRQRKNTAGGVWLYCFSVKNYLDRQGRKISGVQPVEVSIVDPNNQKSLYSCFEAALDGFGSLPVNLGSNAVPGQWKVKVTCLASGKSSEDLQFRHDESIAHSCQLSSKRCMI